MPDKRPKHDQHNPSQNSALPEQKCKEIAKEPDPARSSLWRPDWLFIRCVHVVDLDMTPKKSAPRAAWPMLNFPNPSRVLIRPDVPYDFEYDSAMEWSFFVTENALKRLNSNVERSEASLPLAFDTHRAAIHLWP